jgi:WD40 repeat protein
MAQRILLASCLALLFGCALSSCQAQTLSPCRPTPAMPANPKPGVGGLDLSRDGKTLVVAGGDAKIRLLDLATGEVRKVLTGHTNLIYRAVFSGNEKLLASSSRDLTARIWDVASGSELHKLGGFRCSVKAVGFSPDGKIVAASGNDGMLKLWDVKTGTELKSLVHKNSADIDMSTYSFVFSRNGKKIYAGNGDGTISEWDVESGKETRAWQAHPSYAFKLVLSPDYRLLASLTDSVVKLWDTSNWNEVRTLSMPNTAGAISRVSAIALSDDGNLIAASHIGLTQKQDAYLYIRTIVWEVKTGRQVFTLEAHNFDVDGLVFTRDNRYLLTGSVDRTIKFWDMKTGQLARTITLK